MCHKVLKTFLKRLFILSVTFPILPKPSISGFMKEFILASITCLFPLIALIFTTLWANSAGDISVIVFLLSQEKGFDIWCKLSQFTWNIVSCFLEKVRKIFPKCPLLKVLPRVIRSAVSHWDDWFIWIGPCKAKKCFGNAFMLRMCKVLSRHLLSPFITSKVSNYSVSGQWRAWSDCADAQADLALCCPHMPEDTYSHGTAQ